MADIADVFAALRTLIVNALYPPAITIGGAPMAGDVLSITATRADAVPPIVGSYTVQPGDTLIEVAFALGRAFTDAAGLFGPVGGTVDSTGTTIDTTVFEGSWQITAGSTSHAESVTIAQLPPDNLSPAAGAMVAVAAGWPLPADLDKIAESGSSIATPPLYRSLVSLYAPGVWTNTTRYPLRWQQSGPLVSTLTGSVDASGTLITLDGTVPAPGQVVGVLVGFGSARRKPYAYKAGLTDTLASIAGQLAALISVDTPAVASGPTIRIMNAVSLAVRISGYATVTKEVMRQIDRLHLNAWAPSPAVRDAVCAPIKAVLAETTRFNLADGTSARLITRGDALVDDPEKVGLYRRAMMYDVEYATTVARTAHQVILPAVEFEAAPPPAPPAVTVYY